VEKLAASPVEYRPLAIVINSEPWNPDFNDLGKPEERVPSLLFIFVVKFGSNGKQRFRHIFAAQLFVP
jgi:hypothetical protein